MAKKKILNIKKSLMCWKSIISWIIFQLQNNLSKFLKEYYEAKTPYKQLFCIHNKNKSLLFLLQSPFIIKKSKIFSKNINIFNLWKNVFNHIKKMLNDLQIFCMPNVLWYTVSQKVAGLRYLRKLPIFRLEPSTKTIFEIFDKGISTIYLSIYLFFFNEIKKNSCFVFLSFIKCY